VTAAGAVRAFVAVEPDAGVRAALAGLLRALRSAAGAEGVRFVRPESLHLTLRFLGDTEPPRLAAVAAQLRAAAAEWPPLRLVLGAVCGFPSPRRPRVLACEVGPPGPLAGLASGVEAAVVRAGLSPEARPFRAHLTLGRYRGRAGRPVTAAVTAAGESWDVGEIVLFRSDLERSGAVYTPLERFALGGSDHP
jgi:2'-5' RNA ligase